MSTLGQVIGERGGEQVLHGEQYPGVDHDLLRQCRLLALAMITTWRWDASDRFPDGRQLGVQWLHQLRSAIDPRGLDPHR